MENVIFKYPIYTGKYALLLSFLAFSLFGFLMLRMNDWTSAVVILFLIVLAGGLLRLYELIIILFVAPEVIEIQGDMLIGRKLFDKKITMNLKNVNRIVEVNTKRFLNQYSIKLVSYCENKEIILGTKLENINLLLDLIKERNIECHIEIAMIK